MTDSIKITSPVSAKGKIQGTQKQPTTGVIFDMLQTEAASKIPAEVTSPVTGPAGRPAVLDAGRVILQPLLSLAGEQAQQCMELLAAVKQWLLSPEGSARAFPEGLFLGPEQLQGELLRQERDGTVFHGLPPAFRQVAEESAGDPALRDALAVVLKHFECHVNRQCTAQELLILSENLLRAYPESVAAESELAGLHQVLKALLLENSDTSRDPGTILRFFKNEYLPAAGAQLKEYPGPNRARDMISQMVHYIVRLEQADPEALEKAYSRLAELMQASERLRNIDTEEMWFLLHQQAGEKPEDDNSGGSFLPLLKKALEDQASQKVKQRAGDLLLSLVRNESPILPFHRFVVPLRFGEEEIAGEFIIDKDFRERKGNAEQAVSIFFTLQSEQFGVFEVDLLAKDRLIDLDIKCPEALASATVSLKTTIRGIVEAGGYRLGAYQTGVYRESRTILSRYPKLELERTGIDVKI